MSLIGVGSTILAGAAQKFLGGVFGGGVNIAKNLSKQVGFTVAQADADLVRERIRRGLDPRTGQPKTRQVLAPQPPVPARTIPRTAPIIPDQTPATDIKSLLDKTLLSFGTDLVNRIGPRTTPPVPVQQFSPFDRQVISRQQIPVGRPSGPIPPIQGFLGGGSPRMSALTTTMSGLPAAARFVGGAGGLIRTTTGRISRIILPSGQTFTRKNAASLIRRVGFEAAAVALGITAIEAAELLLTDSKSRRRGRGITAAQVRNARRTTCMVARLARDLGVKAAPARRKTACR